MKEPHLLLSWRDLNLMNTYLKGADISHGRRNMPELNFTRFLLENCQWYDFTAAGRPFIDNNSGLAIKCIF